jgi:hypothetical protein
MTSLGRHVDAVKRTAAQAVQAVTRSVAVEHRLQAAGELLGVWRLTREELDEASAELGLPPLADDEWRLLRCVAPP